MKKLFTLFIVLSLISCNDGDFEVPAFEFTETINSCNDYFLFKTSSSSTEVIYMALTSTQFSSSVGEKTYSISASLPVTYRIFDEGIGTDYFCQTVPPTTPAVLQELNGTGSIIIVTSEIIDNNNEVTGYNYDISFENLLFKDENDSDRVYFEFFDFGTFPINN